MPSIDENANLDLNASPSLDMTLTPASSMDSEFSSTNKPDGASSAEEESDWDDTYSLQSKKRRSHHHNKQEIATLNMVMEHRIFLKAILGLLAERDNKATEIGMNDPNMLKSGPLKKASHLVKGIWKVKFVELRRGMLTYYENNVKENSDGQLLRKNLPLDFNDCSCRAVKISRNGVVVVKGASFELIVNNTRRLWLCKSKAERRAWMDAIGDAMVGGSLTQSSNNKVNPQLHGKQGSVNSQSPYKLDLKKYLKVQGILKSAKTKSDYITTIQDLKSRPLEVPVQWIMEQVDKISTDNSQNNDNGQDEKSAFHEVSVSKGVDQLWKDLQRDAILINQELFKGDVGHGPEKMIGALARNIVSTSRLATSGKSTTARYAIPESKAFAYARDVLLSVNRTRSGGDSYYCIDTLCSNTDLVVITPSSREAEPLSITVEMNDDATEETTDYSINDKSGWLRTRNRIQMSWRKRFFVLSEGTLSLYRQSSPRPHGLRGQMVVLDANISVDRSKDKHGYFVLSIVPKDGLDRFLYFKNESKLLAWAYALELVAKGNSLPSTPHRRLFGKKDTIPENIGDSMKRHMERLGMEDDQLEECIKRFSAKASARMKITASASSEFKIVTMDPQGDDGDTWATISATFGQSFRLDGDRIVRGEETVKFHVSHCATDTDLLEGDSKDEAEGSKSGGRRSLVNRLPKIL
ncbi:unnamed protein product [Cylindrotheca closterium]|uniref:PH domain-containing protein n=1 Tax=Cylindrotheca closterium TaxID=2856 RepID=A0AAD2CBN0_9STRA|nr:unnamed protein product [Cylindrotheca closterium]